ncbi:tRNA dihydrouridine synthase DusB [Pararhizobium mangrovi]|uniref:tRNA-dihydrouridine synthase n=1 Tax=Pararhizobium mangrovi TaxID=2590452 RepID=A0A506UDZ7_9HYPH|nr:tRNA dihydrouridine synthase DusB [Pararhizobium mangrovi]TPW31351.1 tRNA dihydrouridine synthase DusB [Pararhizobium mangrovi]
MKIGPVPVRNRVFLAPMSGVSDVPFRRIAWRFGAGLVVTEMIATRELVHGRTESRVRLAGAGISPHMVQLAGREPYWMGEAARIAVAEGADIVDINMGCPAKKVTGGYAGSALMREPDLAMALIEATVRAVDVPVTLKMRLGWDAHSLNAAELARRAEDAGIRMITVHGRTRCQFYEGRADWAAIAAVRKAVRVPFVANGDVASTADAERLMAVTGADAVMVGRAAQGRPWLPGEIAGAIATPSSVLVAETACEHYRAMIDHYGAVKGVRHARKHLGWAIDAHAPDCPPALRRALLTETDPDVVVARLEQALRSSCQPMDRAA